MQQPVSVPPPVADWLNTWGAELLLKARRGFDAGVQALPGLQVSGTSAIPGAHVVIGTDCSGCEAPVWALRKMGVAHTHKFSSDCAWVPRAMIAANHGGLASGETARGSPVKPVIFDDMVSRSHTELPPISHYVAGFPCKAFSMLRAHNTKLLREKTARPFFAVVATLKAAQPQVAVLENVMGIKRVLREVRRRLQCGGMYDVFTVDLNPATLGEPVHRPRVYMLLVRRDCARFPGATAAATVDILRHMHEACKETKLAPLQARLLPDSHPEVRRARARQQDKYNEAKVSGFSGGGDGSTVPRWPAQHAAFKKKEPQRLAGTAASPNVTADDLRLHLPRERDVWNTLAAHAPGCGGGRNLIVDLSQNLQRCSARVDGARPPCQPWSS